MIQFNEFYKGYKLDIDPAKRPTNSTDINRNVRFVSRDGNTFIAITPSGNQYEFEVGNNLVPIGGVEYNGILYIVSANKNDNGEGAIGCYPSPNWNGGTGAIGFTRSYQHLRNFTGTSTTIRTNFLTNKLNFLASKQCEVEARDNYDGSVNLYITDDYNPIKKINTGFKQDIGEITDETYSNSSFPADIDLISSSTSPNVYVSSEIVLKSIGSGGSMKYGNYIMMARYLNTDLEPTKFFSETAPIQIFDGNTDELHNVYGGDGGDASTNPESNKSVVLQVENPNSNFAFIEIAFVRWYSDPNNVTTYELWLIDQKYSIGSQITVYGTEVLLPLTEADIEDDTIVDNIAKTFCQIDNRLWFANTKGPGKHNQEFVDFAKEILITYDDNMEVNANKLRTTTDVNITVQQRTDYDTNPDIAFQNDMISKPGQYMDYYKTYYLASYFRQEIYGFGVQYEFKTGGWSDVYYPKGVDALNFNYAQILNAYATNSNLVNEEGVFRFPSHKNSKHFVNNKARMLGVKFLMTDAMDSLMAGNYSFISNNIKSIRFVRTDRHENVVTQGLAIVGCTDSANNNTTGDGRWLEKQCSLFWTDRWYQHSQDSSDTKSSLDYGQAPGKYTENDLDDEYYGSDLRHDSSLIETDTYVLGVQTAEVTGYYQGIDHIAPIWRMYMPMTNILRYQGNDQEDKNYMSRFFGKPNNYGFFSPDWMFEDINDDSEVGYINRVGKTIKRKVNTLNSSGINKGYWDGNHVINSEGHFPNWSIFEMDETIYYIGDDAGGVDVISRPVTDFVSAFVGDQSTNSRYNPIDIDSVKYMNYSKDPISSVDNSWMWIKKTRDLAKPDYWFNRSFYIPKYWGLKKENGTDGYVGGELDDMNLDILNLYKQDPAGITDITSAYSISSSYRPISRPINIFRAQQINNTDYYNWVRNNLVCYQGDCFLQRTAFKQFYWAGTSYKDIGDDKGRADVRDAAPTTSVYFTHGLILSVVTENKYNIAMRHDDGSDKFFPKEDDYDEFAYTSWTSGNEQEQFLINHGYDETLGIKYYYPYDPNIPVNEDGEHPVRIWYTDKHIPGEVVDSYRSVDGNNYKDFEYMHGEINRIFEYLGRLVSVQDDIMSQHYIDEKQIKTDANQVDLVMGVGDILSDKTRRIADFGTQHQWSCVKTDNAIYGVDFRNRVIWQIGLKSTSSGNSYVGAEDLLKKTFNTKWLYDVVDRYTSSYSDIMVDLEDNPVNLKGIAAGFDRKYGEVLFTLLNYEEVNISDITIALVSGSEYTMDYGYNTFEVGDFFFMKAPNQMMECTITSVGSSSVNFTVSGIPQGSFGLTVLKPNDDTFQVTEITHLYIPDYETLCYSEDHGEFHTDYDFFPSMYFNINNDMFTYRSLYDKSGNIYRHNEGEILTYYDLLRKWRLSCYVNGIVGDQNATTYTKMYSHLSIESNEEEFNKIEFSTQYQGATLYPYIQADRFWLEPVYHEGQWDTNIPVQDTATDNEYEAGSQLRGKWMKVVLEYYQAQFQYVKNIQTDFIISNF